MWLPARCFIKRGRWIKSSSEKKGSLLKWFLFGNRSKHVLPSIKYPWPSVSRSNGPNAYPIFRMSLFGCEMQMERMATLSQLMCSNRSMWDAFMTSSAAVNKRFFHSSLSGGNCECDLDGHMPVNLPTCLHKRAMSTGYHPLIYSLSKINVEIYLGGVTKSRTVRWFRWARDNF